MMDKMIDEALKKVPKFDMNTAKKALKEVVLMILNESMAESFCTQRCMEVQLITKMEQ